MMMQTKGELFLSQEKDGEMGFGNKNEMPANGQPSITGSEIQPGMLI